MTDELHNKKCVPCEGGIPPFTFDEIQEYLKKVDSEYEGLIQYRDPEEILFE